MVDPTALNEQKRKNRRNDDKGSVILRAFIFSLLGGLAGAAVCVLADYFYVGNISAVLCVFPGMAAYAFYLYFVERQEQKNIHLIFVLISCFAATSVIVFAESALIYAPALIKNPDMNFIQKTFEFYSRNISEMGFSAQKYIDMAGKEQYSISILLYHIACPIMSFLGLLLSWLFVKFVGGSWEKKHGKQDYSYAGRTKRTKKKGKRKR